MDTQEGGCKCGAIEYSCSGKPINSVFCYCTECQSLSGSDKWFGIWFPKDSFTFTKGTPFVSTRKGDSGQDMHQMSCEECGDVLCAEVTVGNFYSVSASTLKNNKTSLPAMLIYTASAPKNAVFPASVPKFKILPPHLGGET
ncbi:GFA family protein [Moritella sp. 36]|uniref:GFA family protein n=1 Tax=Moritella sp. 36 TaxID=2746233 RepID=UPI001BA4C400|nr:GFA family protein [Moritella sp. 36]QUM88932.1 GFA family protein [Moritella sp. 36]